MKDQAVRKKTVYYFAKHPVQYHIGLYRELEKLDSINFKVIFQDNIGIKPTYVKEWQKEIKWDIDPLGGYSHVFMHNYALNPHGGYFSRVNFSIFKYIFKDRPDVIILNSYSTLSDWILMFCCILSSTKIIFRGEATLRGNENTGGFKVNLKKFFVKNWLKLCNAIMYSCSGNYDYWRYHDVSEDKLFPIPCSVDNHFFRMHAELFLPQKTNIKKDLGIPLDDLVILFSAKITQRKRPMDLLKAIEKINHDKITVLFVGDGPQYDEVKSFANKFNFRCIFTGFVNQLEISKYYSISDVNVIISDYDPSPKALNESMNFSLPILATNVIGTANDLVKEGKNGFLVDVGDIGSIANRIEFFNNNREKAKRMGERSLNYVSKWNFSEDVKGIAKALKYILKKNYEQK